MNEEKNVPKLYQHQIDALKFIEDKSIFALFMEMGTGKTKIIIERAHDLFVKGKINCVIIISPNAVKEQWITEQFPEHCPSENWTGYVWDKIKSQKSKDTYSIAGNKENSLFVLSVNVEAFQTDKVDPFIKEILAKKKVFVVIDESTRIKSGRRKPAKGKRGGAKRTNKIIDLFKNVQYKAILTGTPTPNNPFDLWSQFEFLKFDFFRMDHFLFTHYYGIMVQKATQEGRRYTTVLDEKTFNIVKSRLKKHEKLTPSIVEEISISSGIKTKDIILINNMTVYNGYKNLEELRKKIGEITFFVKKKDCLDLPEKVYEKLYCKMSDKQMDIYKTLKSTMYAEYMGSELTVNTKMVMYLRLQMVTGGLFPYSNSVIKIDQDGEEFFDFSYEHKKIENSVKLNVLLEDLEEVSEETSIIVWARFRGEIEMINDRLLEAGYSSEKYYGGSSGDVIDRFKAGETKILVANPLKGGEGLNLQIATLHYFYSNSFKADSRLQAEDRSHRIGQMNKVTYKDILCRNTVDERIYQVLKNKENLINYFRTRSDSEIFE